MGRTPTIQSDEERAIFAWAAREALSRRGMSAREASQFLGVKLGKYVSNQTVSAAVKGSGGDVAIAAIEALLEIPRDRWKEERDQALMASGDLDPWKRYPLLGARLQLAKGARAIRGEPLPDAAWAYVETALRNLALKGPMTAAIADAAIDAAIDEMMGRARVQHPEAKHVDVTPDTTRLVRVERRRPR